MKRNAQHLVRWSLVLFASLSLVLFVSLRPWSTVHAATTVTLNTTGPLVNVDDNEGRWQYDGGDVLDDTGVLIAHFARTKRVSFVVTEAQNTAMLTITIFFLGSDPPENITLQGSHSFNSGGEIGSVSAASSGQAALIGAPFSSPNGSAFSIGF